MRRAAHRSGSLVASLYRYDVYGLVVASEEPFYCLEPSRDTANPALTIAVQPADFFRRTVPAGAVELPEDHWIAHAFLDDGRFYLHAPGVFEAVVSADGRQATCSIAPSVDRRTLEANLLNIVLGTALTLQGEEPLHATAVALDGRAVGFLGPSGAGKSSLAAFLVSRGAGLVTDDVLRLCLTPQAALAQPGPYRLKLLDAPARRFMADAYADGYFNSLSGKRMIRPAGTTAAVRDAVPLAALYFLGDLPDRGPTHAVAAERLAGFDVIRVLLSSAMDDRNTAAPRLARQLRFAAELSRRVPVFALRYPRRFELMEEVADAIRASAPS